MQVLPLAVGVVTIALGAVIFNYLKNRDSKPAAPKSKPAETPRTIASAPLLKPADAAEALPATTATGHRRTLVDPNEKYLLPLIEKEQLSHDSYRYRFGLPSAEHVLGLPIGQHIHLIATISDELVIRAYTPVSSDDDVGHVDLVIKVYRRDVHPKFPNGGKMSQFVDALQIGDTIAFKGPTGKLQYQGNGQFAIKKLRKDPPVPVRAATVNMIAGGTGITPMLQLVREVLKHKQVDKTRLALLYANQTEGDILLRKELDELAAEHPEQFQVWYTLDVVNEGEW